MAAVAERADTGNRHTPGAAPNRRLVEVAGLVASCTAALVLFTRFSIDGALDRDEAIYAYGGQRMAHGTAPYASIFDPKNPLATILSGTAAGLARAVGRDTLFTIRLAFFCCAVLTVAAVYLLVLQLWRSVPGALAAAVVFASYTGFAEDAIAGPDAKTPGILFAVAAMWLAARRRWFWAAFLGGMAFLVWQPFLFFPLAAVIGAVVCAPGRRWRALGVSVAGAATPVAVTALYFAWAGAFGEFVESAYLFPLTGVRREKETVLERVWRVAWVVHHYYGFSGVLLGIGSLLLVVLIVAAVRERGPLVLVVGVTLLGEVGYACYDFQGYPDVYPLLPYGAIGVGGAVAVVLRRAGQRAWWPGIRAATTTGVLAGTLALAVVSAWLFSVSGANGRALHRQWAAACAVERILVPGTPLLSLGDPVPLVLTGRRNPDRFIYLGSGVARWKTSHTAGGFAGWTAQVRHSRASVVVSQGWQGPVQQRMGDWLRAAGYRSGHIGRWWVFLTPRAEANARADGLAVTRYPTAWPSTVDGHEFRSQTCQVGAP